MQLFEKTVVLQCIYYTIITHIAQVSKQCNPNVLALLPKNTRGKVAHLYNLIFTNSILCQFSWTILYRRIKTVFVVMIQAWLTAQPSTARITIKSWHYLCNRTCINVTYNTKYIYILQILGHIISQEHYKPLL